MTDAGLENCEGIISIENDVRKKRGDIFYNTTVGTWASPFWFHVSNAVWRQEGDFGKTGVGDDREQWITYRDRLVYQNFVDRSPICPINTLMTHGIILTRFGDVSKTIGNGGIAGLATGLPIDIDKELTMLLPGSSVFVFDGVDNAQLDFNCVQ